MERQNRTYRWGIWYIKNNFLKLLSVLINTHNFKFTELIDAWFSSQHGAYLMSSVQNTGGGWNHKIVIHTSKIIRSDQQLIFVLPPLNCL